MQLFLLLIYLSFSFRLNYGNTNESSVNSSAANVSPSNRGMILNMNIFGQTVELNLAENHKLVSTSFANEENNKEVENGIFSKKNPMSDYIVEVEPPNSSQILSRRISKRSKNSIDNSHSNADKNLELAVFVDDRAYHNLISNNLVLNDDELHELILGFINQIQAIYYQKSLEQKLHISLVKIEIQKSSEFSQFNGNRDELLKSFCEYQAKMNIESDSDPSHWDMALLLTGFDLFVIKDDGSHDFHPLGLGSISGICTYDRNCVIVEFEPINRFGQIWPSSGLMSTWAAAHEMAHNLGILHDGLPFNSECPMDGFLMSSSRGTRGETNWSKCSAYNFRMSYTDCLNDKQLLIDEKYNHNKYNLRPGLFWDSDKQCKMFLRDNNAFEFNKTNAKICNETLLCETHNKLGIHPSGPALEGTQCGPEKWCVEGLCTSWTTHVSN